MRVFAHRGRAGRDDTPAHGRQWNIRDCRPGASREGRATGYYRGGVHATSEVSNGRNRLFGKCRKLAGIDTAKRAVVRASGDGAATMGVYLRLDRGPHPGARPGVPDSADQPAAEPSFGTRG